MKLIRSTIFWALVVGVLGLSVNIDWGSLAWNVQLFMLLLVAMLLVGPWNKERIGK